MQKVRTSRCQLGHIHKDRNPTNFKIVHHCHQLMKTRKILLEEQWLERSRQFPQISLFALIKICPLKFKIVSK